MQALTPIPMQQGDGAQLQPQLPLPHQLPWQANPDVRNSGSIGGRDQHLQGQGLADSEMRDSPWRTALAPIRGTLRGQYKGNASLSWLANQVQQEVCLRAQSYSGPDPSSVGRMCGTCRKPASQPLHVTLCHRLTTLHNQWMPTQWIVRGGFVQINTL